MPATRWGTNLVHEVSFRDPHWQRQALCTVFHLCRKPQRRREMSLEVKSDSMILLRLELPGKCSPASWAPCLPGDLGKVNPVSGDRSMKTSPKGRVWAQKSTLLCRAPGFPGSAQPANRKTFHEALRRYLRKRKVESFKEESSALSKNCFKGKKINQFLWFQ